MEKLGSIEWGFIFSALGITLGWILNQLSQWLLSRQNDKKNLKLVLFNLLESYFALYKSDIDKYIESLVEKLALKISPKNSTEALKEELRVVCSQVLKQQLVPKLYEDLRIVQSNYQNAVEDLAPIDPITAYYLSGRPNPLEAFEQVEKSIDVMATESPEQESEIDKTGEVLINKLKPTFYDDALNSLEWDILKISWKVNPKTWFRSKKAITQVKLNAKQNLDKNLDELLDILESIIPKIE
ncbi:MAG: hypothetical protein HRT58_21890 [Crocinitomicaceae bacterium]|nr:hypothetical protein [Flavobacteriales bacterium]NQZ38327.1 hypothetical protein [Crocinitomicaceae bacterium]